MEESILKSVKKMLGLPPEDDHFDIDIITNINSAIVVLNQLGVGDGTFAVTGDEETWTDFLGENKKFNLVRSYIVMKVRIWYDPPTQNSHIEAVERSIKELECRISYAAEIGEK